MGVNIDSRLLINSHLRGWWRGHMGARRVDSNVLQRVSKALWGNRRVSQVTSTESDDELLRNRLRRVRWDDRNCPCARVSAAAEEQRLLLKIYLKEQKKRMVVALDSKQEAGWRLSTTSGHCCRRGSGKRNNRRKKRLKSVFYRLSKYS